MIELDKKDGLNDKRSRQKRLKSKGIITSSTLPKTLRLNRLRLLNYSVESNIDINSNKFKTFTATSCPFDRGRRKVSFWKVLNFNVRWLILSLLNYTNRTSCFKRQLAKSLICLKNRTVVTLSTSSNFSNSQWIEWNT